MNRRFLFPAILAAALAAGQGQGASANAGALALAKRQAAEATLRSRQLEARAAEATNAAERARAAAAALAARIEAAEADITAAEARIRIIEDLRAGQRARLAERQRPVVHLTAALQTMARRPPALALVQPGSLDDLVHVRSLLASTLPVIRARTSGLREEIEAGETLRRQAEVAVAALVRGQEELKTQRFALARLEADRRLRSQALAESALLESDRALAFGEEARDIAALMGTREHQAKVRQSLSELPGPMLRPPLEGEPPRRSVRAAAEPAYILPVEGRLVRGMGEISDAGVHARGLTFDVADGARIVAPRDARVAFAGPFRGYGEIVILDHGSGWTTLVTNLASLSVEIGDNVKKGALLGRAGASDPRVSVELRRRGRPFPIAPLIASR